jgi:hypothetical protein
MQLLPRLEKSFRVSCLRCIAIAFDSDVMIALLKLAEETDLDILNSSMETMVEHYQAELLPVAAELTARLVCYSMFLSRSCI